MAKSPFFSRYVERQPGLGVATGLRAGRAARMTLKYPSDIDDGLDFQPVTMKYPSDQDEDYR